MSNLTKRLSKLARALTQPGDDYQKIFKEVKNAYYGASDEGKSKMIEQWDKDGL